MRVCTHTQLGNPKFYMIGIPIIKRKFGHRHTNLTGEKVVYVMAKRDLSDVSP